MINKKEIFNFIIKFRIEIILIIILLIQIILVNKISLINTYCSNLELKINNIQTILWISEYPDKNKPTLMKWKIDPIKSQMTILPVRPNNTIDVAYIEKWYTIADNYYPVWKDIIYVSSDDIFNIWTKYKEQLLNTGWQILSIVNNKIWNKEYVESLSATNWQKQLTAFFLTKVENYNKKAWAFVKLVINN